MIRQPDGRKPRYVQAFADRPTVYPDVAAVRPDRPLIAVEGELDALLLGQELAGLAVTITLGSAARRAESAAYWAVAGCPVCFAAHDADEAGDRAAAWPRRAVRVRPPAGKDWTEARQAGIDLRRWWIENVLADAFDREERAAIREYDAGLIRALAETTAAIRPADASSDQETSRWTPPASVRGADSRPEGARQPSLGQRPRNGTG